MYTYIAISSLSPSWGSYYWDRFAIYSLLLKLRVPLLGQIACYSLILSWGSHCWDRSAIYSFAKRWVPAGTRANHAAVGRFASCQHHHFIIGVLRSFQISLWHLLDPPKLIYYIVTKWMNHEVCIHVLLLTAFAKLGILSLV